MVLNQQIIPTEVAKEAISLVLCYEEGRAVDPIAELEFAESSEKFSFLLQLANGDPEALAISTTLSHRDADLLKMSAINYLVHHCFDVGQDPWRVLGLNKRATADEVKRRYHQMIKLFHPDRALLELAQLQNYAVKINRAYQVLKSQDELAAIDVSNNYPSQKPRASSNQTSSWLFNARFTGRLLFGLVALGLLMIYLKFNLVDHEILISNRPLIEDQENNVLLDDKSKIDIAEQVDVPEKLKGQETQRAQHDRQHPLTQPNAIAKISKLVTNESINKEAEQKQDPASIVSANVGSKESSYQEESINSYPLAAKVDPLPSKIRIEEPVYVPPITISQRDLKLMIVELMDAYNQGSLDVLMSLMADNITVNGSAGKNDLRLSYGMLFAKSKQRDMLLRDVRWQLNGNKASGTMGYIAHIKNHGDSSFEVHQGVFNLDVTMLNNRLQIVGLQTTEDKN